MTKIFGQGFTQEEALLDLAQKIKDVRAFDMELVTANKLSTEYVPK